MMSGLTAASEEKQPNVLLIMSDDLCTALSGFGHRECKTPHLDRLAARGVKFERAYCQFPLCGPSRTSIMTGLYPGTTGATGNKSSFRKNTPNLISMSELFLKNGYTTTRISKIYHMGVPPDILSGGDGTDDPQSWGQKFNIKGPEQNAPGDYELLSPKMQSKGMAFIQVEADGDDLAHADGMAAKKAVELLGEYKNDPFFLAVGFVRPHVPLVAPRPYFATYPPEAVTLPEVPEGDLDDVPVAARAMANEDRYGMNEEQKKKALAAYYASVSYMDAQVGKLLDALDAEGLTDRTVVVFTSDHGYNMGEHDCWQKLSLFEDTLRVPFIISAPWLSPPNRSSKEIVELIDLYPTLADLCGLEAPKYLQGATLRPLLDANANKQWNKSAAYTITKGGESLRTADWRLNRWGKGSDQLELYDQINDPNEYTNLANNPEYAKIKDQLLSQLRAASQKALSARKEIQ
jgi:choline-sulfatase